MKVRRERARFVSGVCAAVFLACAPVPAFSEVNVNINVGPPPVLVQGPPELIVVPRTMVYFAPAARADLFFYRGRWWTRHEGRWFRSSSYNGPWVVIGPRYVPVEIVRMPREYRTVYVREQRVPYGQLKKHWEHREYERRTRGGEWREGKEEKRERKEERKENRGHGRD
jgi:hypothetical protein